MARPYFCHAAPAFGRVSGLSTQGETACVPCGLQPESESGGKCEQQRESRIIYLAFFRTQLSLSWELRLLAEIPTMGLSSWLSRCNTVALTVPSIARVRAFTCVFAAHLRRQATGVTLFGYGQWPPTSCCYLCSTVCGCWPALWHAFCGLGRSGAEHIKHWHGVGIWWPSLESHWRPPRGVCVAASSPTVSF